MNSVTNKKTLIVLGVILALVVVMMISMTLSMESIGKQKEMLAKAQIELIDGDNIKILSIDDINILGEENFKAVFDTSISDPVVQNYSGVQLINLLQKYDIDIKNKRSVIFSAADGYSVAYSIDEVLRDKNVYLSYKQDGMYLESKDKGGRGPYEVIIISDQFSNRRCKWLTTIELK